MRIATMFSHTGAVLCCMNVSHVIVFAASRRFYLYENIVFLRLLPEKL